MKRVLLYMMCAAALAGCGTAREPVVEWRERVVEVHDVVEKIDSVVVKDSVIVKQNGDTVFVDRWRWRDRWQYIDRWRDSLVYVHDSIDRPVYIYKPLTKWEQWQIKGFWLLASAVAVVLAWRWRKVLFALLKRLVGT